MLGVDWAGELTTIGGQGIYHEADIQVATKVDRSDPLSDYIVILRLVGTNRAVALRYWASGECPDNADAPRIRSISRLHWILCDESTGIGNVVCASITDHEVLEKYCSRLACGKKNMAAYVCGEVDGRPYMRRDRNLEALAERITAKPEAESGAGK